MSHEPKIRAIVGRRNERRSWNAEVLFRSGHKRASVKLRDISTHGARVEGVFLVREGDHFFLKLPGMESIEGRVAWVTDFEFGCEFIQPLNQAVLDARVNSRF